jgi:hypothetical protein
MCRKKEEEEEERGPWGRVVGERLGGGRGGEILW